MLEISFLIIISHKNGGFEHPATLVVGENEAFVLLNVREKEERSLSTKMLMRGRLKKLEYEAGKTFTGVFKGEPEVRLPLKAFKFVTIGGSDISKARLHGTLKLRVECTVGPTHMPPSICMLDIVL